MVCSRFSFEKCEVTSRAACFLASRRPRVLPQGPHLWGMSSLIGRKTPTPIYYWIINLNRDRPLV